ncbi:MAG: DUF484 family protein [Betaproteobacteria bacterium]|nr:DUF484 family protein [Betaproteobacteria bacterium]
MSDKKNEALSAESVMCYLEANTQFFEQYADRLAAVFVPHPYGGRAISLTERQIITYRDQIRKLERKYQELSGYGEDNDAISEKMQRLTLALLGAEKAEAVTHLTVMHLREDFAVPHVDLLWRTNPGRRCPPGFVAVGESLDSTLEKLEKPYCGSKDDLPVPVLFGQEVRHIRSQALTQLRVPGEFGGRGILAMGSEEPERFYAGMGTLYLQRMAEIVSAALARCLKAA